MKRNGEGMEKMVAKGMKKVCVEALKVSTRTTCPMLLAQPKHPEKIEIEKL